MKTSFMQLDDILNNDRVVLITEIIHLINSVYSLKKTLFYFFHSDLHMIWGKNYLINQTFNLRVIKYLSKSICFTIDLPHSEDHLKVEL